MASQPQQPVTANTVQGTDAGTDTRVRTLDQTQGTGYNKNGYAVGVPLQDETGAVNPTIRKNPETGELYSAAGLEDPAPPKIQPGAGSNDDAGPANNNATQNPGAPPEAFTSSFVTSGITPRPNILDRYPSYTWQASVYMITPAQYAEFLQNQRRRPNNYNLLFQSGGAANSNTPGVGQGAKAGAAQAIFEQTDGRNPFFPDDFYIDNIVFNQTTPGKGSGAAHSITELKFTLTEPANITLFDRLYLAVQDLNPLESGDKVNYASIDYLMIIRFFALDEYGKLVQVQETGDIARPGNDRYTLVEKYIPFRVASINMTIDGKLVNYEWNCVTVGFDVAMTTRRGTIPFDVQLEGGSVDDLLNGTATFATVTPPPAQPGSGTTGTAQTTEQTREQTTNTPPPPKVSQTTITQGLIAAMNEQQQTYVKEGRRNYADEYRIEYSPEAEALIKKASITKPSEIINKDTVASSPAISENTQVASPDKQRMNVTARNYPIVAGMQMVQAIELIIRNSHYITDQANIVFDETTNLPKPNATGKNKNAGLKWFNIVPKVIKKEYDTKINDYAVQITYQITPYEIRGTGGAFFPNPVFQGVHKQYYYWFTGQNTAVLDYKETFNNLYQMTITGATPGGNEIARTKKVQTSSMTDMPFYTQAPRSNESSQSANNRANELAANLAENIYNPADLKSSKMRILGDPAWIMQGSVVGVSDVSKLGPQPFNDDGSINFDTQDILYEIAWQKPEDYTMATGLADPYSRQQASAAKRLPLQSRIYKCITVLSEFRGGMFEQTIEGVLYNFPIPDGTNGAPDQPAASATQNAAADGTAGNGDYADARQDNSTGSTDRTSAATPTIVAASPVDTAGGIGAAWQASIKPATDFLNSARLQNTAGGDSALRVPNPTGVNGLVIPGVTSSLFPNTPADTAIFVQPPAPPTSNGSVVDLGTQLNNLNINTATTVLPQFQTTSIVGRGRLLSLQAANQGEPTQPQIIVRDA